MEQHGLFRLTKAFLVVSNWGLVGWHDIPTFSQSLTLLLSPCLPFFICLLTTWVKWSAPVLASRINLMVHIILYCSEISHQTDSLLNTYLLWTRTRKITLTQSLTLIQVRSETDLWLASSYWQKGLGCRTRKGSMCKIFKNLFKYNQMVDRLWGQVWCSFTSLWHVRFLFWLLLYSFMILTKNMRVNLFHIFPCHFLYYLLYMIMYWELLKKK